MLIFVVYTPKNYESLYFIFDCSPWLPKHPLRRCFLGLFVRPSCRHLPKSEPLSSPSLPFSWTYRCILIFKYMLMLWTIKVLIFINLIKISFVLHLWRIFLLTKSFDCLSCELTDFSFFNIQLTTLGGESELGERSAWAFCQQGVYSGFYLQQDGWRGKNGLNWFIFLCFY